LNGHEKNSDVREKTDLADAIKRAVK